MFLSRWSSFLRQPVFSVRLHKISAYNPKKGKGRRTLMKKLSEKIIHFFQNQNFVIVATIDREGGIHNSCKGIAGIERKGLIYLLDLYLSKTYENLRHNPHISITAVDEHKFIGYTLKGKAGIAKIETLNARILKNWDDKVTSRITHRLLKNIRGEKGHPRHPEAFFPKPKYMIIAKVEETIDLAAYHPHTK